MQRLAGGGVEARWVRRRKRVGRPFQQSIHLLCALLLLIASLDSGHALRLPANAIATSPRSTAPTTASVAEAPPTTENDLLPTAASDELLASLRKRRADIADGAGKRYRVASQVRIAAHTRPSTRHAAGPLFSYTPRHCVLSSLARTGRVPQRAHRAGRSLPHGQCRAPVTARRGR